VYVQVLALSLFIPIIFLCLKNLRYGLYLLILSLPLNNRILFDLGQFQVIPVRLVLAGIFLVSLYRLFSTIRSQGLARIIKEFWRDILTDKILFLLLLLGIARLFSIHNPVNLSTSLNFLIFYFSMVGLYCFTKYLHQREGGNFLYDLYKFHAVVVIATVLYAMFQVGAYEIFGRILPGVWPSSNEPTRFGATFWDINHYGPYVTSVIPYFFIKLISSNTAKEKYLNIIGFTLANIGLLLTLSRSSWLGAAMAYLVLGILILKIRLRAGIKIYALGMTSLVGLIIVGVLFLHLPFYKRIASLSTNIYNPSVSAHKIINRGHFSIFEKYPVFGGGYGNFSDRFRESPQAQQYFEIDPIEGVRLPSHSIWFEALSETGAVGLTVFILFWLAVLLPLWRGIKANYNLQERLFAIALFSSLCGLLFSGLFYHYNLEYFWLYAFVAALVGQSLVKKERFDPIHTIIIVVLVGLATSTIFPGLGKNALIDWDESIYAQVSKNILRFRDPITLRWHLEKFWFEKPPLYLWLTSLLYAVNQINEFSARFFSAIAGVIGVVMVYLFGGGMKDKRVGLISALILLSTVHWLWQSRNGTLDVFASMLITLTMYLFFRARTNSCWNLVAICLGLVLMTKGIIFVIPLLSMLTIGGIESFIYKKPKQYPLKSIMRAVVVFLIIVLPWHLANYMIHGKEFINSYFFYHVLERSSGIEGHSEGFFWYLTVIRVWARQNAVLFGLSILILLSHGLKNIRRRQLPDFNEVFLIIWISITFLIFSASVSKIQWYIIPIYPIIAIIIGYELVSILDLARNIRLKNFATLIVLGLLILSVPFFKNRYRSMWDLEDSWRGVAEVVPHMKYEARKIKSPRLLIVNMSPGPAMFYSDYPTDTGNYNDLKSKAMEVDKSFFAVGRIGDAQKLMEELPNTQVILFKQYEDFALFGRW